MVVREPPWHRRVDGPVTLKCALALCGCLLAALLLAGQLSRPRPEQQPDPPGGGLTGASGRATAPPFTANTVAGSYTVRALASGGSNPSAFLGLTNLPGPAASFVLFPSVFFPRAGDVDPGVPFGVFVVAVDQYFNVATDYTGTVSFFTPDATPGAAAPPSYTFTAADRGVAFVGLATLYDFATFGGFQALIAYDLAAGIFGFAIYI